MKNKNSEILWVITIICFCIIFLRFKTPLNIPPDPFFYKDKDHSKYLQMAENPLGALNNTIPAPFCYRILVPILAWILPFDLITNFHIITLISLSLAAFVLYLIIRENFNKCLSFSSVFLFFSIKYCAPYLLYNIYLVDSLLLFLLLLSFWAIIKSKRKLYSLSLSVGVLCKEVILFTIPVFIIFILLFNDKHKHIDILNSEENSYNSKTFSIYLKIDQREKFSTILNCILTILPSIIIFFIIRYYITPISANQSISYQSDNYFYLFNQVTAVRIERFRNDWMYQLFSYTFYSWGFLIPIFLIFIKKKYLISWLKKYLIFVILVYAQTLIAVNTMRLIVIGFYPVIDLSIYGMDTLHKKYNINIKYLLIISIVYFLTYDMIFDILRYIRSL